jgi:hypothetical protein
VLLVKARVPGAGGEGGRRAEPELGEREKRLEERR